MSPTQAGVRPTQLGSSPGLASLGELLADFCEREQVPGAAVCVFDRTGPVATHCHGVTDVESGARLGPDTLFRIYSVAKLLTASAALALVRRGDLELDAPLDSYLDGLHRRGADPTILTSRQALSHTGGLVPDSLTWARLGRNDDDLAADVLRDYARAFSFAAPGRHYGYCNAGFNLSAVLLERLTGAGFAQAMRTLLFDPVGMPRTTHDPAEAMTYPLVQHHAMLDGSPRVIHTPLAGSKWLAGSQCYSSMTELARFGSWLLAELDRESDPGLRVDQPTADLRLDVGTHYGLGCYLTPTDGRRPVVGHEGFFSGSWVKLAVDPDRDRGILWMDNRGDELRDARYRVIEQLMPGLLPPVEGRVELGFGSDGKDVLAADVAGSYQRIGSPALRVSADGTDLLLDLDGRRRRLSPFGRGIWRAAATAEDTGCWRPHAGSGQVCLGTAPPDDDGTRVVHLNAIPYSSSQS